MKQFVKITRLLIIILLVSSCGFSREDSYEPELDELRVEQIDIDIEETHLFTLPQEIINLIEENRRLSFPPYAPNFDERLQELLTPFDSHSERDAEIAAFILDNPRRWAEGFLPPAELTHQEILGDIDFLIDLLKYGYAAYQYVGGDAAFNNLRELMIHSLSSMDNPLDSGSYVYNLLRPYLMMLISDNHVHVQSYWAGGGALGVESRFYINEEMIVNLTAHGYVTQINGQIYNVLDYDNLFPTLTPKW